MLAQQAAYIDDAARGPTLRDGHGRLQIAL